MASIVEPFELAQQSKTKYVTFNSANDRIAGGTLNRFTIDLTSASELQNCVGCQLVTAGFTPIPENVPLGANTIVVRTELLQFTLPPGPIQINFTATTFEDPPVTIDLIALLIGGTKTPDVWAQEVETAMNLALFNAFVGVTITIDVVDEDPLRWRWSMVSTPLPRNLQILAAIQSPLAVAGYIGLGPNEVLEMDSVGNNYFTDTFTDLSIDVNDHVLTIPPGQYDIDQVITALNAITPGPLPYFIWNFSPDELVDLIRTPIDNTFFRVLSVIEDPRSTLAPLIGYQGYTAPQEYTTNHIADTSPGLVGLTTAYLHIRRVATGNAVTIDDSKQPRAISLFGQIDVSQHGYGQYVFKDFSGAGSTYAIRFDNSIDLRRLDVRLRDEAGRLIPVVNPGVELQLKMFME